MGALEVSKNSTKPKPTFFGLVGVYSASQLDDTVPVFLSTNDITSDALIKSYPVLADSADHAVHSSAHYYTLSEIQLNDTNPFFHSC